MDQRLSHLASSLIGLCLFGWALGSSPVLSAQSDEFSATTLGTQWTWFQENAANWSLSQNPGALRIIAERGDIAGTLNWDARNILLQSTRNDADFVIETSVAINPTADFHQGGLLALDDVDHYVKLVRAHSGSAGGSVIEMASEANGVLTLSHVRLAATTVHLRLSRSGDRYTGEYSLPSTPGRWTAVDTLTNRDVVSPDVGLMAITGPFVNVTRIPVDFDYFRGSGAGWGAAAPHVVGPVAIGQTVFVDVGAEPDAFFVMAASLGTVPGIPLGTRRIPLNPDVLFFLSLAGQTGGIFNAFRGYLNSRGEARSWISIPNDPALLGLEFYLAFVTLDASEPFGIGTVSESTKLGIGGI